MLPKNRASFINECQISTLTRLATSAGISSHISDTDKRFPRLSVGPPRSMSAAGCLLMSALSRRN